MFCRPARSSKATKGVVFHVSAHTAASQVMFGSERNGTEPSPSRAIA